MGDNTTSDTTRDDEYPYPEVLAERGYDQTEEPAELANAVPTAVPTPETVERATAVAEGEG